MKQFDNLPRLLGRATVEFVLEKPVKGDKFNVEGTLYDQARLVSHISLHDMYQIRQCFQFCWMTSSAHYTVAQYSSLILQKLYSTAHNGATV
jgi:hypothetical protein